MQCFLDIKQNIDFYLEIKHSMSISVWLNNELLKRREIQGLDVFKLSLMKGFNELVVKAQMDTDDLSFEATLHDSLSIARIFAEQQSGNIIYPLINGQTKRVTLTNAHQQLLNIPVELSFFDVKGKNVCKVELLRDSFNYYIPELKNNHSYICEMHLGRNSVRQPVSCNNPDSAYIQFIKRRRTLPDSHSRANEIDQLLYRYQFLLNHPSRYEGDWWWQFKIGQLIYEIDHIFARIDSTYGRYDSEPNIQFITYNSSLDGGTQRYVVATPNHFKEKGKKPLVIVIRPDIEKHWHFFTCPQIARQWAINQMQSLANKYKFIVMMPEIRSYEDEDLTPMASAELDLAIKDVCKHFDIDTTRIFLHANCSGGYRALRYATNHPKLFAGIALYAPVYERYNESKWSQESAPVNNIHLLRGVPFMIHYDPTDTHNPLENFERLINDCKREDIPLTLSIKRNSGRYYNVLLTGEEAFCFFNKIKGTNNNPPSDVLSTNKIKNKTSSVIADFYSSPFIYVYHAEDTTYAYRNLVDSIKFEYEQKLFSHLPLKADNNLNLKDFNHKNLFFIGNCFNEEIMKYLNILIVSESSLQLSTEKNAQLQIINNPLKKNGKIILYSFKDITKYEHVIHCPWNILKEQEISRIY